MSHPPSRVAALALCATALLLGANAGVAFAQTQIRAQVATYVADADENGSGDNAGNPASVPSVAAAAVNTPGVGTMRFHIEWNLSGLSEVTQAEVQLTTLLGTIDSLGTQFYAGTATGNGTIEVADFQTAAGAIAGAVMPVSNAGQYTFDVTAALNLAIAGGFTHFVVQGRVVDEATLAAGTTHARGLQVFTTCAVCLQSEAEMPQLIVQEVPVAEISLVKSGSVNNPPVAGDTVSYSFEVTNTGNVELTGVTVTDPLAGLSAIACPETTLAPDAQTTCTATYELTQADLDAGSIQNTATATGDAPEPLDPPADEDGALVTLQRVVDLSLDKSGSVNGSPVVGATVNYSFLVTNNGNVTLTDVGVIDPLPGLSAVACPQTTLAPAAQMTCTATYAITQANLDAGSIQNTASATGNPPQGLGAPTVQDTAVVALVAVPTLSPTALVLLLGVLALGATRLLRRGIVDAR